VCNLFAVDTEANKTASGRPHATASQMLYGKAVALMVRWDLPPTSWRRRYVGATRAAAFAPLEFVVCLAPTGSRECPQLDQAPFRTARLSQAGGETTTLPLVERGARNSGAGSASSSPFHRLKCRTASSTGHASQSS
jgi:hypothetical protein